MEGAEDDRLVREDMRDTPLVMSIDSRVQQAGEGELGAAMAKFNAIGAAGIVLDVHKGEGNALKSLPSCNPNDPAGASPKAMFNPATLAVYEIDFPFPHPQCIYLRHSESLPE